MNQTAPLTPAATVGQQVVITVDQAGYEDRQLVGMQGMLTYIDTVSLKDNIVDGDRGGAYQIRLPDGDTVWVADVRPADEQVSDDRVELARLRRMRTKLAAYIEHGDMPDGVRRELRKCMHC
ncbi:hypothetical protein [Streptomyces botrytidirepellens]|uniref:Uncharacterized protein n=1 Tax=Streptomyces botrytidirepellens TaxID=2486417 RepID=A0A3M8WTC1_9ACTN|nr:hypothetical protein [Streptomyces botrytidirepellens]RNG31353.1 hypothetical protein EEJ42_08890 [Streptomyces botrytidirepellens]